VSYKLGFENLAEKAEFGRAKRARIPPRRGLHGPLTRAGSLLRPRETRYSAYNFAWPAKCPNIADKGLVEPRSPTAKSPTLGTFFAKYLEQRRSELAPASIKRLELAKKALESRFGADILLSAITRTVLPAGGHP
jgi:hypothetical protein